MTANEVDLVCQRFFEASVRPKQNLAFEQEWRSRSLSDPYFTSLAYFCVCAVLDDEATRHAPAFLTDAAKVLAHIEENDRDYQHGSVTPWSRLGDVHRSLGNQQEAIKTYNRGIDTLTRTFNWKSGELLPAEAKFGRQYSEVELLHARRGRSELELAQYGNASKSFASVLESLNRRGTPDMVNAHFPQGIKKLLDAAQAETETVVTRTSLSPEQVQSQQQGSRFARAISRFLGK